MPAYWALTSSQFIPVTVAAPAVVPPTGFSVQAGVPEGQWVRLFRLNGAADLKNKPRYLVLSIPAALAG